MPSPISAKNEKSSRISSPIKAEKENLRGTFAAVMMLGGFLILTWLGVFLLFIARN
ncbi:cytochrome c oxidase subunit 2A [Paenibacillus sp. J2TS4]|uniref:cytochrome c oxidase subunit 2A n=1 Tax=Paenibacillus sp. J2TS4 TaxID=2807194 RepID=UPI001B10C027|nr:cytochrome c oxidase subunit 2A [Paenibacillus sp. J2TS4]GIP31265.1 hypothetical protein J2TS4_04750 [Paenibacillus sp. J2TS4]